MKAVLMSIRPEWCAKIAIGHKTVEIRKTMPKLPVPFKVYIYCTEPNTVDPHKYLETHCGGRIYKCNGKVFAEFVCDRIRPEPKVADGLVDICLGMQSCVDPIDILKYANGKSVYSWHISDLVIYDKPKELNEFKPNCRYLDDDDECRHREVDCHWQKFDFNPDLTANVVNCTNRLTRPPQSWCYVNEVTE